MNKPEEYRSALLDRILSEITPQERNKVWLKMHIAVRIADLLKEKGLRKKDLAEACGLKGASMVTKWLSGGHNFTLDTLVDISHAFGVSVAELVRQEEQKVVFSSTVVVQVPALSPEQRTIKMGDAAFVGRSSNAIGSITVVSEPHFNYGQQQPCLA